jgi:hypothetical protein
MAVNVLTLICGKFCVPKFGNFRSKVYFIAKSLHLIESNYHESCLINTGKYPWVRSDPILKLLHTGSSGKFKRSSVSSQTGPLGSGGERGRPVHREVVVNEADRCTGKSVVKKLKPKRMHQIRLQRGISHHDITQRRSICEDRLTSPNGLLSEVIELLKPIWWSALYHDAGTSLSEFADPPPQSTSLIPRVPVESSTSSEYKALNPLNPASRFCVFQVPLSNNRWNWWFSWYFSHHLDSYYLLHGFFNISKSSCFGIFLLKVW